MICFFNIKGDRKRYFEFCNDSIFYDCNNIGIIEELSQVRKCTNKNFHKATPVSRIIISLSLIDDIILKINGNDIEDVIEDVLDLRENIINMLSFGKLVGDNGGKWITEDKNLPN